MRQTFIRFMNRFVVFVRGTLIGQIQSKILRLSALDAQDRSPATLMDSVMDQIMESIPDILELPCNAFEAGASMSDLRRAMPGAWHAILAWAIGSQRLS